MRFALVLLLAAACAPPPEAKYQVRGSVEQIHVTHAEPGQRLEVRNGDGVFAIGTVDELGSLMFRRLKPGTYFVGIAGDDEQSGPVTVMSVESSTPKPELYTGQSLVPGLNYIKMRDGTTLSAFVTLPGSVKGRYPTVVNYSGYSASKPGTPNKEFEFLCTDFPIICTPPYDGTTLLAGMGGYATVSVNMRGTGCSGGAYDYFETMQVLDGYDVIEIVAAQPWVMHHKVGMVGLSYPGISQLFVAAAKPPSLAAIAPMSVIGNTQSTLLPGGILNDGFAISWVDAVLSKAVPYGQGWEKARVDGGDEVCKENQLLHGQLIDNVAQARLIEFYDPAQHDQYNPTVFAPKIEVPVFLASQWQDEQTGPYFHTLFDRFTGSPAVRLTATNGVHIDALAPQVVAEWQVFLDLFVARRVPVDPKMRAFAPFIFDSVFQSKLSLPDTRLTTAKSVDEAIAAWKAEPKVRVIFETGFDPADPGSAKGSFEQSFPSWPPPTTPVRLYFQSGGALGASAPAADDAASIFRHVDAAGARGVLAAGGDPWDKLPAYNWRVPKVGEAVSFTGEPLDADLALVGTASVDLWVLSDVGDADLQVTLSEVRPDGKEMYVQSGWMRASFRKPGPMATPTWADQTFRKEDAAPVPVNVWTEVRVPTAGFAHVLRKGSRVKITVDTPGGTRADWRFAIRKYPGREVFHAIGHDRLRPSSVALPKVELGGAVPALPPCPSLRGQPCRAAPAVANVPR